MKNSAVNFLVIVIFFWFISGCSSIQSSVSEGLAKSLSTGISNQSDVEMVKAGIPSYLLMIDGMILEDPENESLYAAGVKLYGTLANFVKDDKPRHTYISDKAYQYSKTLLCLKKIESCKLYILGMHLIKNKLQFCTESTQDKIN